MTRHEFIEDVGYWYELINFCYDYGCPCCDSIYDDDQKDEYFNDNLVEMARNADSWQDMLRELEDIPDGDDYYICDDYEDWQGVSDSDFGEYKDDVLQWADEHEVWDADDEEEDVLEEEYEANETSDEDEDDETLEEGCSLGELFSSSATKLQTIETEAEREREQAEQFFEQFIAVSI